MDELKKLSPEEKQRIRAETVAAAMAVLEEIKLSGDIPNFVLLVHRPKLGAVEVTGSTSKEIMLHFALMLLYELEEKIPAVEFPLAMLRIVQEVEFSQPPADSTEPQPTHSAPERKQ